VFVPRLVPPLIRYSTSIIAIYILGILLLNVDYLIIGRYLGPAALGIYTLAFRIPELLIKQFHGVIQRVLFPVLSKIRDDHRAFRYAFLTSIQYITTLTVPLGLGTALVSRPFILTFFTEKWAEAIPIMSAIALYTLLRSLFYSAGMVYKSMGRPEILTYLNLTNVVIIVATLWWTIIRYGTLEAVAWTQVIVALVVGIIRLHVLLRFLNISYVRIFRAFQPGLVGGFIMSVTVWGTMQLIVTLPPLPQLVIAVSIGVISYGLAMVWFERDLINKARTTLQTVLVRS
jgi:PST family polysaccharide transporter